MYKSRLVKLASMLIALSMLFSLAACGSNNTTAESDSSKAAVSNSTQSTATAEKAPDPFGKYEPGITLTAVRSTLSAMKFPEGDDVSNNVWTREIESVLGIKVNYTWTADATQYGNKLNVSIASGDIPDFFECSSQTVVNMAKYGQLADLSQVYEKYASSDLKATMDAFPEGFNSAKQDGKLVALSQQGFGIISMPAVVWIRDDWMKKTGLSAPKTFDDVTKMAETFAAQKIDGQKDTYGVAITKDLYGDLEAINGIANAHHAYPFIWVKDASGQIAYGSIQPEMKNALKTMQDWYKKGLISTDFGVKDTNKVNEDIISGKVGIEFGACWNSYWPFTDLVKKNTNALFKPYAIPSTDDKPTMVQAGWPVANYYAVSKNCKNPEAVIKLANYFNKKIYHGVSEDYSKFIMNPAGDELYKFAPLMTFDPTADYNKHVKIAAALKAKDSSQLPVDLKSAYDTAIGWVDKKDANSYGAYYQLSEEGSYGVLKNFVDEKRVVITELQGSDTATLASKRATLEKLEKDTFTKIILGESIDEFDKFVDNWKKLGGDEITKEMNATYNK
jgi:putative aldouronate transport system substrate-binding protein